MNRIRRAVMILGLLALAPAAAGAQETPQTVPPAPVTAQDRIYGQADAPVTVIEYASFICSHCATWHLETLPAFRARYIDTGQVRLVYRDLPTPPGELSRPAALLSRCAAPDTFAAVAQSLYAGQAAVLAGGDPGGWLAVAAALSGKPVDVLVECVTSAAEVSALDADVSQAQAAGVLGTPTFFVNGRHVADGSLESLSAAIDPLIGAGG